GKTGDVYRFLLKEGRPVGPREIQRELGYSSPTLASHHLEKLLRSNFISKTDEGKYEVPRKAYTGDHLKTLGFLVPRFFLHATVSLFFLAFWLILYFFPYFLKVGPLSQFTLIMLGVMETLVLSSLFLYEMFRVLWRKRI
ncbi:MAG: helix-turn-helix domain-containing protein, partial [Thaumarchaeota archaeon]|nr:helix-turn-helix domain-containing protein [Nitrososphaerota archaeon]